MVNILFNLHNMVFTIYLIISLNTNTFGNTYSNCTSFVIKKTDAPSVAGCLGQFML